MSPSELEPTSSLMFQLRTNDPAGLPRLINLYAPVVARWCRREGLQQADADNVLQQVFLAISRHVANFRQQSQGSLHSWISTITRNQITDHFRRQQKQLPALGGSDFQDRLQQEPAPESSSGLSNEPSSDRSLVIRRALDLVRDEFENTTWQAFWRVVVDGQAPKDVAQELGISASAVSSAKWRVKKRLHQELEGLFD